MADAVAPRIHHRHRRMSAGATPGEKPLRRLRSRSLDPHLDGSSGGGRRGEKEEFLDETSPAPPRPGRRSLGGVERGLRRRLGKVEDGRKRLERLAAARLQQLRGRMHFRRRKRSKSKVAASPRHADDGDESSDDSDDDDDDDGDLARAPAGLADAVVESAAGVFAAALVVVVAALSPEDVPFLGRYGALAAAVGALGVQCELSRRAAVRLATASLAPRTPKRRSGSFEDAVSKLSSAPASPTALAAPDAAPASLVALARSDDGAPAADSWSRPSCDRFPLRGPTYLADGVKVPSAPALYDTEDAYVAFTARGAVRSATDAYPEILAKLRSADAVPAAAPPGFPRFLVVAVNAPLDAPSLGGRRTDGRCVVVVFACRLNAAAAASGSAGAALARQWIAEAPGDLATSGRLKGVFFAEGDGVPRLVQKWNGKPVLMADKGRPRPGISAFSRGDDYLEFNIDVGLSFSYMARGAIYLVQDKLVAMDAVIGFTIEGKAEDELPEQMLGAVSINRVDWRARLEDADADAARVGGGRGRADSESK